MINLQNAEKWGNAEMTIPDISTPLDCRQKEFDHRYIVLWSDIDQFQHMSFANYGKLIYQSSDSFFLDYYKSHQEEFHKIRLIPYHSQIQFKDQSEYGDNLSIEIHSGNISLDRFDLYYVFKNEQKSKLIAVGKQSFRQVPTEGIHRDVFPDSLLEKLMTIQSDIPYPFTDAEPSRPVSRSSTQHLKLSRIFTFDKLTVFFKHTNYHGHLHSYNYLEWTSFVREAFFQQTVPNFKEVLERSIKMMTTKIGSTIFFDSEFGDEFEARLTVGKIKKVSFDMIVRFFNKTQQQVTCETVHTIVFTDTEAKTFANVPSEMREVIVNYPEARFSR